MTFVPLFEIKPMVQAEKNIFTQSISWLEAISNGIITRKVAQRPSQNRNFADSKNALSSPQTLFEAHCLQEEEFDSSFRIQFTDLREMDRWFMQLNRYKIAKLSGYVGDGVTLNGDALKFEQRRSKQVDRHFRIHQLVQERENNQGKLSATFFIPEEETKYDYQRIFTTVAYSNICNNNKLSIKIKKIDMTLSRAMKEVGFTDENIPVSKSLSRSQSECFNTGEMALFKKTKSLSNLKSTDNDRFIALSRSDLCPKTMAEFLLNTCLSVRPARLNIKLTKWQKFKSLFKFFSQGKFTRKHHK
eukprot:NODE_53_length_30760_cov_1.203712.p13 type:complete len:302 gc:universal NODE_53_length_30760_cov_1.203712:28096-29001(+)